MKYILLGPSTKLGRAVSHSSFIASALNTKGTLWEEKRSRGEGETTLLLALVWAPDTLVELMGRKIFQERKKAVEIIFIIPLVGKDTTLPVWYGGWEKCKEKEKREKRRSKCHHLLLLFSCSVMSDCSATPWTIAHKAPLSMGFSRQEYWSGLHFLLQEIFQTQGSNSCLPHWQHVLYSWATMEVLS